MIRVVLVVVAIVEVDANIKVEVVVVVVLVVILRWRLEEFLLVIVGSACAVLHTSACFVVACNCGSNGPYSSTRCRQCRNAAAMLLHKEY